MPRNEGGAELHTPPANAPKLGLREVRCWDRGCPPRSSRRQQASRSAGHWCADLTSGSSSVLDSASFCQVESSGEFRPDQHLLSTWGRWDCREQCPSPRVLGQGLRGAMGVQRRDKSVCQN